MDLSPVPLLGRSLDGFKKKKKIHLFHCFFLLPLRKAAFSPFSLITCGGNGAPPHPPTPPASTERDGCSFLTLGSRPEH